VVAQSGAGVGQIGVPISIHAQTIATRLTIAMNSHAAGNA